jgi:hypothetical protein
MLMRPIRQQLPPPLGRARLLIIGGRKGRTHKIVTQFMAAISEANTGTIEALHGAEDAAACEPRMAGAAI